MQQIPSKELTVRLMFKASTKYCDVVYTDSFDVDRSSEIQVLGGWKKARDIKVGDVLLVDDGGTEKHCIVSNIQFGDSIRIYIDSLSEGR